MQLPSFRLTPLATLAVAACLAVVLWTLSPVLVGREFHARELLLVGGSIAALLEWGRRRRLRRDREHIENLRDSALW